MKKIFILLAMFSLMSFSEENLENKTEEVVVEEKPENTTLSFSGKNTEGIYYVNLPYSDDYELKNGLIKFELVDGEKLYFKFSGIFFNYSDYKIRMKVEIDPIFANGKIIDKIKLEQEFKSEDRTDFTINSISDGYWSSRSYISTGGNKAIIPLNGGIKITLYNDNKVIYTNVQKIKRK